MNPVEDNKSVGGTYELWQLDMKQDCHSWTKDLVTLAQTWENTESRLYGAWNSVVGPMNTGILLWRHQNIDTANKVSEKLKSTTEGELY